jgi:hypothetical protein
MLDCAHAEDNLKDPTQLLHDCQAMYKEEAKAKTNLSSLCSNEDMTTHRALHQRMGNWLAQRV